MSSVRTRQAHAVIGQACSTETRESLLLHFLLYEHPMEGIGRHGSRPAGKRVTLGRDRGPVEASQL